MPLSQPVWSNEWSGLLIRLPLGLYLFLSSRAKLGNLAEVIEKLQAELLAALGGIEWVKLFAEELATLLAVLLPFLEMAVGILLILGLWTTLCGIIAAATFAVYTLVHGMFPDPDSPNVFSTSVILFFVALSLLASGAGAFSIDGFKKKG